MNIMAVQSSSAFKPQLTIRPTSGWQAINFRELWEYRDLLLTLASRDVKIRYKQTALGVAWVVLQPLISAAIFAFVFGRVAKLPSDGVPYFLFSYVGLQAWSVFSNTLTKANTSLVGNAHLVSKVYFPRLILPLSTVPSTLLDFGIAMVMLVVLMLGYHVMPGWALLTMPIWLLLITMLALGAGLFSASLAVSYRDINYILPVATQFLMYASPVAYGVSAVPEKLRLLYFLNPLSGLLEAFRWSVIGRGIVNPGVLAYSTCFAIATFVIGLYAFRRMEDRFADVI